MPYVRDIVFGHEAHPKQEHEIDTSHLIEIKIVTVHSFTINGAIWQYKKKYLLYTVMSPGLGVALFLNKL